MSGALAKQLESQQFSNGYVLVDGCEMHAANPDNFHIPPAVIKRNLAPGMYVELRIDSPRFSVHEDAPEKCPCPSCNGEMSKPILRHEHPATLVGALPEESPAAPSRGWGEDFWVQIQARENRVFEGAVDNQLVEERLHGLAFGDTILFHEDHVLAVHDVHREDLVRRMDVEDLKALAAWVAKMRGE